MTVDDVLAALLATIHDEWSNVGVWALSAHEMRGMPDSLPEIIVRLQMLEAKLDA